MEQGSRSEHAQLVILPPFRLTWRCSRHGSPGDGAEAEWRRRRVQLNCGVRTTTSTFDMAAIPDATWPRVPHVGVGCIVVRSDGQLLMVRNHRGFWSTPGGHLDFGESPAECAARETFEETGVPVSDLEFVAITNDVLPQLGRHYITIWMRASAAEHAPIIHD